MAYTDRICQAIELSAAFNTEIAAIRTECPTWRDNDARLGVFGMCAGVAICAAAGMSTWHHVHVAGSDAPPFYPKPANKLSEQVLAREFNRFIRVAFADEIFYAVESSFRLFLFALDPSAAKGSTAEFEPLYRCFFKKLGLAEWEDLLRLFRLVRNTGHTNGVFMPRNGKADTVTWGAVRYEFVPGTQVEIANWPFVLSLATDVLKLLSRVVRAEPLRSIPAIPFPFQVDYSSF